MSKKVQYFSHDFSARNDTKLISLRRKHGMTGLGVFWSLVEMLYESGGELASDDETLENIAYEWRIETEMLKSIIFDCNIFVVDNGKFYSKSVNSRLKKINEASEKMKKLAEKRWKKECENDAYAMRTAYEEKNEEKDDDLQNIAKSMRTAYKNDATRIPTRNAKAPKNDAYAMQIKKEINKKINNNSLNPLSEIEVGEESPKSEKASDEKSVKSVLFKKFFEKFPKKTHEKEAEIAFVNLTKAEIEEISRVLPSWLKYWATIDPKWLPNAYSWLFDKAWKNAIPEATQSHPMAVQTEKMLAEQREKQRKKAEKQEKKQEEEYAQKTKKQRQEREYFLQKFASFPEEKRLKITEQIRKKFEGKPVKEGDSLWQIELVRILKNMQGIEIF